MDSLVAYLVAAMVGWVPAHAQPQESPDEVMDRYESIARDAATGLEHFQLGAVLANPTGMKR